MLSLILFLSLGAMMVYLAQNNLDPVTLRLGTYFFSAIPLFYVIIGSLITGLVLGYLVHLINSLFTTLSLHKKDNKIKQGKDELVSLTKRIHGLELENEKLKNNTAFFEPQDKNAL